jgi:hypothetical protein
MSEKAADDQAIIFLVGAGIASLAADVSFLREEDVSNRPVRVKNAPWMICEHSLNSGNGTAETRS